MNKSLSFITFIFLVSCSNNSPDRTINDSDLSPKPISQISLVIDSLRSIYAPDKRVALFDIKGQQRDGKVILLGETNLVDPYTILKNRIDPSRLVDSVLVLPSEEFKVKHYGIINISTCNIRAESRHSSELSTQAILGTPIKIYKRSGGWYYIQTPDGYLGWLNNGTFITLDQPAWKNYQLKEKCVFVEDIGKAYESPSLSGQTISDLSMGNILVVIEKKNSVYHVEFPDGRKGYIAAKSLIDYKKWVNRPQPTRSAIISTAQQLLGRPYLWGGTSSKAMDCSGFTKTVFFAHQMILPRDASQQVLTGSLVTTKVEELDKAAAGDLLFFGRIQDGQEKVTHVGIYLGNSRMIHSGDGRVQIQSLDPRHADYAEKRRKSFLRAKDMLVNVGSNGVVRAMASEWY